MIESYLNTSFCIYDAPRKVEVKMNEMIPSEVLDFIENSLSSRTDYILSRRLRSVSIVTKAISNLARKSSERFVETTQISEMKTSTET